MTMNSSGPISLGGPIAGQSIAKELELGAPSYTSQISISDPEVLALSHIANVTNDVANTSWVYFTDFYSQRNIDCVQYSIYAGGGTGANQSTTFGFNPDTDYWSSTTDNWYGYNYNNVVGSVSGTVFGYQISYLYQWERIERGEYRLYFALKGFSSNPGRFFISSLTCNGQTISTADAGYTYSSFYGEAEWSWITSAGLYFGGPTSPTTVTVARQGASGSIKMLLPTVSSYATKNNLSIQPTIGIMGLISNSTADYGIIHASVYKSGTSFSELNYDTWGKSVSGCTTSAEDVSLNWLGFPKVSTYTGGSRLWSPTVLTGNIGSNGIRVYPLYTSYLGLSNVIDDLGNWKEWIYWNPRRSLSQREVTNSGGYYYTALNISNLGSGSPTPPFVQMSLGPWFAGTDTVGFRLAMLTSIVQGNNQSVWTMTRFDEAPEFNASNICCSMERAQTGHAGGLLLSYYSTSRGAYYMMYLCRDNLITRRLGLNNMGYYDAITGIDQNYYSSTYSYNQLVEGTQYNQHVGFYPFNILVTHNYHNPSSNNGASACHSLFAITIMDPTVNGSYNSLGFREIYGSNSGSGSTLGKVLSWSYGTQSLKAQVWCNRANSYSTYQYFIATQHKDSSGKQVVSLMNVKFDVITNSSTVMWTRCFSSVSNLTLIDLYVRGESSVPWYGEYVYYITQVYVTVKHSDEATTTILKIPPNGATQYKDVISDNYTGGTNPTGGSSTYNIDITDNSSSLQLFTVPNMTPYVEPGNTVKSQFSRTTASGYPLYDREAALVAWSEGGLPVSTPGPLTRSQVTSFSVDTTLVGRSRILK